MYENKPLTTKLTTKQDLFCREYIIDLNATKAAIRAGYSKKSAHVLGTQTLKIPKIRDRIDQLVGNRGNRLEISADNVLKELAKLAFHNPADYTEFDEKGDIVYKASNTLTSDQMAAISSIKKPTGGDLEIKFYDKGVNLERLARHLKLFSNEPIEANISVNVTNYSDQKEADKAR